MDHKGEAGLMPKKSQFTVGHISYLNCVPFFYFLREFGFSGKLVSGVPSELNRMLQQGEIDVSPSSSFEYARNWRKYILLPGHSISSTGPVKSVLLFSPVPLASLSSKTISVTGDSATSINLLRVLLREYVGLEKVNDQVPEQPVENMINEKHPALLIGDRALRMAENLPSGMLCFDLGQLWYQYTGLPFIFALWMARKESLSQHPEELFHLEHQLSKSRERFFKEIDSPPEGLDHESILSESQQIDYWKGIDYDLDDKHIQGLKLFIELCLKYELLTERPNIEFLQE